MGRRDRDWLSPCDEGEGETLRWGWEDDEGVGDIVRWRRDVGSSSSIRLENAPDAWNRDELADAGAGIRLGVIGRSRAYDDASEKLENAGDGARFPPIEARPNDCDSDILELLRIPETDWRPLVPEVRLREGVPYPPSEGREALRCDSRSVSFSSGRFVEMFQRGLLYPSALGAGDGARLDRVDAARLGVGPLEERLALCEYRWPGEGGGRGRVATLSAASGEPYRLALLGGRGGVVIADD